VKIATEEGFTSTSDKWFDGKPPILIALDNEFKKAMCVDLSKKGHDYYFGSYSHFYIHEEMLKDTVRTRAY